jgi:hypothetical protein
MNRKELIYLGLFLSGGVLVVHAPIWALLATGAVLVMAVLP